MSEETKQYCIVAIAIVLVVAFVASCHVGETRSKNEAVVEMVKAGADPAKANCAIRPSYTAC